MNCYVKTMLCFACFFQATPESIRSKIQDDFITKQEKSGYQILTKMVRSPDKFHGFLMGYYGIDTMTRDQARRHIIINVEDLLCALNSEKKIVDSFYNYPLVPGDIAISYVYFESEDEISKKPYVSSVRNNYNEIIFEFTMDDGSEEEVRESYNEAYEKVFGKPREPLCEPKKSQS